MSLNIYRGNLRGNDADERNILVDINALPNEVLGKPPHFISAKILVLECEFHVVCLARILVKLERRHFSAGFVWRWIGSRFSCLPLLL